VAQDHDDELEYFVWETDQQDCRNDEKGCETAQNNIQSAQGGRLPELLATVEWSEPESGRMEHTRRFDISI
jgi:hypothetical protein